MKNAATDANGLGKVSPQNIVERMFNFAVRVVQLSGKLDERPGTGRVMRTQILRAGTSVPANVEEAQAAQGKADFASKMSIALKEAREPRLQLRLLMTAKVFPDTQLRPLILEADEIRRIIGAIIVSTKRNTV
jgi:four helix bundle protein